MDLRMGCEMDLAASGQGQVMCSFRKIPSFAYYEKKVSSLKQAVSQGLVQHGP
jgi:hypothetical protein